MPAVPYDFTLRYSIKDFNASGALFYEGTFSLNSNGSAEFADWWSEPNMYPVSDFAGVLGSELVSQARDAMNEDDLTYKGGTYNDANWDGPGLSSHVEELVIATSDGNVSLRFLGDAMIGILPNTYVVLSRLILQLSDLDKEYWKISVDVSATLGAGSLLTMTAVVRNNASHQYSMAGACEEFWSVKVVRMNGCGVVHLPSDSIRPTCVVTVGPGASYAFEPQTWNATGLAKGRYVVLASPGVVGMAEFEVTEDLGHENSPPLVFVEATESPDSDGSTFEFDASESCDVEDFPLDLEVRWDWYSDGSWDIEWTFQKTAKYTFENVTGYNFTVEVRDFEGLSSSASFGALVTETTSTILIPSAFAVLVVALLASGAILLLRRRKL